MKEKFYTIGYYIRKAENIPDWLGIPSEKLLSASTCLNEAHPPTDLVMSSAGWRTGRDFAADAKEYRAKYGFNEKEQIAKSIEGLGEPVDWIPFRIELLET